MVYQKKCVLRETTPNKLFFSFQIIIPFFSLFVKDLYFLNEGCSNKLPNGDINFEKFWQLAKQISDFITWQQAEVGSYIFYQQIMSRSIWQCIYTQDDVFLSWSLAVYFLVVEILISTCDYLCARFEDNVVFLCSLRIYTHVHC